MDELYHHGIDGQQWGVRNGPPYPLDSGTHNGVVSRIKAKREADKAARQEKKHEKLVSSADAKTVAKYERKGEFTTDELKQIYNRLNVEKQISEIQSYNAQEVLKNLNTTMDLVSKAASSGSVIYNVFANLHNAKDAQNGGNHQWVVLGQDTYAIRKKQAEAESAESNAKKSKLDADVREKTYEKEIDMTNAKNESQYWDQKDKSSQQHFEYDRNEKMRTALRTSMDKVAFDDPTYALPSDYWTSVWGQSTTKWQAPTVHESNKSKKGGGGG